MIPQIPTEMITAFKEPNFSRFLRQANITKAKGFSVLFIFTTIFMITFKRETWFEQTTMSKKSSLTSWKGRRFSLLK